MTDMSRTYSAETGWGSAQLEYSPEWGCIEFSSSEDTLRVYFEDKEVARRKARAILYYLAELLGEKLASQLTEDEARELYYETSW